ncbi:MAG: septation protein SpoVG family protein [Candidatus Omnitrophica bacterium]|nr:septation protein SpoVG family protein [Candidatus Omnitrophota bacterium]
MEITEVRVALRQSLGRSGTGEHRLRAYATVTFDHCFVVRNIKIIDGTHGLFVAMPSRKPKAACARCAFKNDAGGRFCTQCGTAMPQVGRPEGPGAEVAEGHRDIAHPITADFRQVLQQKILEAYEAERAKERLASSAVDDTA